MNVYHGGSIQGFGRTGTKLTKIPVQKTFFWENQEIFLPAVYVGEAGAVLDVCAKLETADMAAFLKKWNKDRRLSLKTREEYEQIEAENPGSRNFRVETNLNDIPLKLSSFSSINWYPESVFRMGNETCAPTRTDEWDNDPDAEKLMEAYACDRECCWHFERLNYCWTEAPVLLPREIALTFQAEAISVTAGHFTTFTEASGQLRVSSEAPAAASSPTEIGKEGNTVKTIHPVTGREYRLTLYECEQTRHSFDHIGAEDMSYPEYCHMLSYGISPEIDRRLFDIRDCADGDQPRKKEVSEKSGGSQGATALFMAGKTAVPHRQMAASSMHFEPVSEIRWRMVFQILPKEEMKIRFSI